MLWSRMVLRFSASIFGQSHGLPLIPAEIGTGPKTISQLNARPSTIEAAGTPLPGGSSLLSSAGIRPVPLNGGIFPYNTGDGKRQLLRVELLSLFDFLQGNTQYVPGPLKIQFADQAAGIVSSDVSEIQVSSDLIPIPGSRDFTGGRDFP